MKKMHHISHLCAHQRKFVLEIVHLWLKNQDQRIYKGRLMQGGLIHGVTQVLRKQWAYLQGGLSAGGPICRRLVGEEFWYVNCQNIG